MTRSNTEKWAMMSCPSSLVQVHLFLCPWGCSCCEGCIDPEEMSNVSSRQCLSLSSFVLSVWYFEWQHAAYLGSDYVEVDRKKNCTESADCWQAPHFARINIYPFRASKEHPINTSVTFIRCSKNLSKSFQWKLKRLRAAQPVCS